MIFHHKSLFFRIARFIALAVWVLAMGSPVFAQESVVSEMNGLEKIAGAVERRLSGLKRARLVYEAHKTAFAEGAAERVGKLQASAKVSPEELIASDIALNSFVGTMTITLERASSQWVIHRKPSMTYAEFSASEGIPLSPDSILFSSSQTSFEAEKYLANNQAMYFEFVPQDPLLTFGSRRATPDWEFDHILGVLTPEKLRAFQENEIQADGELILLKQRFDPVAYHSTWDPRKDYALVELKQYGAGELRWSGTWIDYRQVGGFWIPGSVEIRSWSGPNVPNYRHTYKLLDARVNGDVTDEELAGPVIPKGTRFFDGEVWAYVDEMTAMAEHGLDSLRIESRAAGTPAPSPSAAALSPEPTASPASLVTPVPQAAPVASPESATAPVPKRSALPLILLLAVLGIPAAILFLRRKNP